MHRRGNEYPEEFGGYTPLRVGKTGEKRGAFLSLCYNIITMLSELEVAVQRDSQPFGIINRLQVFAVAKVNIQIRGWSSWPLRAAVMRITSSKNPKLVECVSDVGMSSSELLYKR